MKEIIFLVLSLGIILLGAEFFTNGVEWLGRKLNLGEGAVGSVLAAVGTAMPETIVPVTAILTHNRSGGLDVGIGAILGAPFMLGTLALFVVGTAVLLIRRSNRPLYIKPWVMLRDIKFFIFMYFLATAASFLPTYPLRMIVAAVLFGSYCFYVYQALKTSHGEVDLDEEIPACYFSRKCDEPRILVIAAQILAALLIIIAGADLFVDSVEKVASDFGVPVFVLAIIITPIATELPEKFNSVLWVRRGKDTLAMGNITGAMVFQSSVIPAIGITLTPWKLEPLALASAMLVLASASLQYFLLLRKRTIFPAGLLLGGLFYAGFIYLVLKGF